MLRVAVAISGVPQIYAANQHDLFFAQGYVHAQDRFWQMDFWRHIGSARLSEMFGASTLGQDKFLRTLQLAKVVETELAVMDPDSQSCGSNLRHHCRPTRTE